MATGQHRWKLASADGCSEPDPTWTRRETRGSGGGWAPGAETEAEADGPSRQGPRLKSGEQQGCTTYAGGVWEAREALPRADGGVMGSMAPAQGRRRRLRALPPPPQRSATDTPVQGTPLLGASLHLCPHHAARQPGSIPGSLAQSIAIPPTTELLRAKFLPLRPCHPHSRGRWSGDSQAAATNVRTMGRSGRGDGRRGNSHHPLPVSTVPVHGPEPSYHSD